MLGMHFLLSGLVAILTMPAGVVVYWMNLRARSSLVVAFTMDSDSVD